MKNLIIPVLCPGDLPILAGRLDGRRAFVRMLEQMESLAEPTLIIQDFAGVELATSSFLSEAVVRFRDHLRLGRAPSYLAVANLHQKVAEELDDLLTRSNDALIICSVALDGTINDECLLGSLERKLKETFDLVQSKGETSAAELHSETSQNDLVGPTAWNNRLNLLSAKSLLMEVPIGRTKKYRPLLEVK